MALANKKGTEGKRQKAEAAWKTDYSDPSPWSVDYPDDPPLPTVVKLKSFIKENLRSESNDSFTGSSDDNISEGDITGDTYIPGRKTPEPQPLTRTNVTLHDRIWSKDLPNSPQHSEEKCLKLLKSSSNEDLTKDTDSSPFKKSSMHFDSHSERSCDSLDTLDKSCDSQDTMVLTVTDNQSQTYAFHNRVITQDGTCSLGNNPEFFEIPQQLAEDYIPIRRSNVYIEPKQDTYTPSETEPVISTPQSTFPSNPGAYLPKPFMTASNYNNAPRKPKKNLKVSFADPVSYEGYLPNQIRSRLEEDGDDGYGSTDNLSSETCSSNSTVNSYSTRTPAPSAATEAASLRPDEQPKLPSHTGVHPSSSHPNRTPVNIRTVQKPKPSVLPKPRHPGIKLDRQADTKASLKTNYGYVHLQRVPSFRKMNQDLRKQKAQTNTSSETKDSTLQRKLNALCLNDEDLNPDLIKSKEFIVALAPDELYRPNDNSHFEEAEQKNVNFNFYNSLSNDAVPAAHFAGTPSEGSERHAQDRDLTNVNNIYFDSHYTSHEDEVDGCGLYSQDYYPASHKKTEVDNPVTEQVAPKRYTYNQNAVPTKGILKKHKVLPKQSYSFDSYDQDNGFTITVHDQAGSNLSPNRSDPSSSIQQSVIPEHMDTFTAVQQPQNNHQSTDLNGQIQLESEMNALYAGHFPEADEDNNYHLPVHKIMLEKDRYRTLVDQSPVSKLMTTSVEYGQGAFDNTDTLHRKQMRKATEQLYGNSLKPQSGAAAPRAKTPSLQRIQQEATIHPQGAEFHPKGAEFHSEVAEFPPQGKRTSMLSEVNDSCTNKVKYTSEGGGYPLERMDSLTSVGSSVASTGSIYERYNVPLDNALLYKTHGRPQSPRANSPGGSDTSTTVDSGFNDTFDGNMPLDGAKRQTCPKDGSVEFNVNVNRLQRAIKEGGRILSSSGLNILSSHKQQMESEYSKYLKLLNKVQKQQRRVSAPVISDMIPTDSNIPLSRQQPMKAQFVKTADLYRMMDQKRRPPTPPTVKQTEL